MSGASASSSASPPPSPPPSSVGNEESCSSILDIGNSSSNSSVSNSSNNNNSSSSSSSRSIKNNNSSSSSRSMSNSSSSSMRPHFQCGVCQDVYRDPRLLPCHHSFCLRCLEDRAGLPGHTERFPCPTCSRPVHVPPEGVQALEKNFHVSEDDLELERAKGQRAMCDLHPEERLKLFCIKCQRSICTLCKMTDHEKADGHRTESLSDTAVRCREVLEASKERLEEEMREVRGLYEGLVRRAEGCYLKVVNGVKKMTAGLDSQTAYTQLHLDVLTGRHQRLAHALGSANDAEVVEVEREEREVQEAAEMFGERMLDTYPMPLLNNNTSVLTDGILAEYFGHALSVNLPFFQPAEETLTTFYTCQDSGLGQKVHFLHRTQDGHVHVLSDGQLSTFQFITVAEDDGRQVRAVPVEKKPSFDRGKAIAAQASNPTPQPPGTVTIFANSNYKWILKHTVNPMKTIIIRRGSPYRQVTVELHNCQAPVAMDVNETHTSLAVIGEYISDKSPKGKAQGATSSTQPRSRSVLLYSIGSNGEPRLKGFYLGNQWPFHPKAVSFWLSKGREVLLVADRATDTVHVLDTSGQFVRLLAAGSPLLLRPTALDTRFSAIYIGCETGAILRCEPRQEGEERAQAEGEGEEEGEGDAVSDGGALYVDNVSEVSTTLSEAFGDEAP